MSAVTPAPRENIEVPVFGDGASLHEFIRDQYGEDVIEGLRKAKDNAERLIILNEAVHAKHPEMNGRSKEVARDLLLNKQELERKEGWTSWLWRKGTDVVKAPFRMAKWVWQKTFVEHPYLTIGAIIALVAAAAGVAYYSGSIELLLQRLGVSTTGAIGDTIKELPIEPGGTMPQAPDFFGVD